MLFLNWVQHRASHDSIVTLACRGASLTCRTLESVKKSACGRHRLKPVPPFLQATRWHRLQPVLVLDFFTASSHLISLGGATIIPMFQIARSSPVYDVLIIGSAPGGRTVTKVRADLGVSVALLDVAL